MVYLTCLISGDPVCPERWNTEQNKIISAMSATTQKGRTNQRRNVRAVELTLLCGPVYLTVPSANMLDKSRSCQRTVYQEPVTTRCNPACWHTLDTSTQTPSHSGSAGRRRCMQWTLQNDECSCFQSTVTILTALWICFWSDCIRIRWCHGKV